MLKTVLITGAGFSMPYGYPSGKDLVKNIIKEYKNHSNHNFSNLASALKDSAIPSIDRFLNEHPQYQELGIKLIAKQILKVEIDSTNDYDVYPVPINIEDQDDDIVDFLLNTLNEDDFKDITIITFNYDRYFKWRLYKKIKLKYPNDDEKTMRAVEKLKIIHIHGYMVPFNEFDSRIDKTKLTVPYGLEDIPEDIFNDGRLHDAVYRYAVQNFYTVYSPLNEDISKATIDAIKAAQRVFFLGFGFDDKNMEKLGILQGRNNNQIPYDWNNKVVGATSIGIKPVKLTDIQNKYPFLRNNLFQVDAKNLFESYFDLLNPKNDQRENKISNCCDMNAQQELIPPERIDSLTRVDGHIQKLKCKTCEKDFTARFDLNRAGQGWILGKVF